MKIDLKVYYTDSDRNFYCLRHAIQESLKETAWTIITSEVEDKDHAYNYPQCCKCEEFV